MGPEVATNIGSMIRALENAILPAIAPEQKHAQEQAYAILLYLRLLVDQHDKEIHFRLQEIREFHALNKAMLERAEAHYGDLGETGLAVRRGLLDSAPLVALAVPTYDRLAEIARDHREATEDLTRHLLDLGGPEKLVASGIADLLLQQAGGEILRERAWVKALGVDPDPQSVPPISELLSEF